MKRPQHEVRMIRLPISPVDPEAWALLREAINCAQNTARRLFARLEVRAIDQAKPYKEGQIAPPPIKEIADWAELKSLARECAGTVLHYTTIDRLIDKVKTSWMSRDPEHTKCRRGFLVINSRRRRPVYRFLPLPVRLCKSDRHLFEVLPGGHGLILALAGERRLTLKIGTVDPQTWRLWAAMTANELRICDFADLRLGDRGCELLVGYRVKETEKPALNPERVLELAFGSDAEHFFHLGLRAGHERTVDARLSMTEPAGGVLAGLARIEVQQEKIDLLLKGRDENPKIKPQSGHSNILRDYLRKRSRRLSLRREHYAKHWNHAWSLEIRKHAERWLCGKVVVMDLPEGILGRSWPWANFRFDLEYKLREIGAAVEFVKSPTPEKLGLA